jgi:alpha-glucosidase
MPAEWKELTVEAQTGRRGSTLELYRKALKVRRTFATTAPREVEIIDRGKTVLAFRRGPVTVVLNAGTRPVRLPQGKVVVNSGRLVDGKLPPNTAVWIR